MRFSYYLNNFFSNEMVLDTNLLGLFVIFGVFNHIYGFLIVFEKLN